MAIEANFFQQICGRQSTFTTEHQDLPTPYDTYIAYRDSVVIKQNAGKPSQSEKWKDGGHVANCNVGYHLPTPLLTQTCLQIWMAAIYLRIRIRISGILVMCLLIQIPTKWQRTKFFASPVFQKRQISLRIALYLTVDKDR